MRDRLFSAVRTLVEAAARREPMIFAVEDIHWADEGMLDLIEYLARWVRGPVLILCLARDELLDRRPGWGGGRLNATTIALEPLARDQARELVAALMPGTRAPAAELVDQVAARSGGNPAVRRGDGQPAAPRAARRPRVAARDRALGARRAARLPCRAPSAACSRPRRWSARPSGRARSTPATTRSTSRRRSPRCRRRTSIVPTAGSRLAGEREYAFKHVLIRDVAYSTLPKAVRARRHAEVGAFISARAADRSEGVVAMVAEHYGRAATLGAAADLEPDELRRDRGARAGGARGGGRRLGGAVLQPRGPGPLRERAHARARDLDPAVRARIAEKLGDVALRLGRVDRAVERLASSASSTTAARRTSPGSATCTARSAPGSGRRAIARARSSTTSAASTCSRTARPCIELVRLYEEAASLYMHTGDNMLAIYASEKALRLAERLGEAAAASRAHGIFGRVFGRIGDSERARENLERSVELARESDPAEAVRALFALGYHLEVSEADYEGAGEAYGERPRPRARDRRPALAGRDPRRARPARDLPRRLGGGRARDRGLGDARRARGSGRQALLSATRCAACSPGTRATSTRAVELLERAFEIAEQVGRSEVAFESLLWLAAALRDRGDHADADQALARALDLCERAGLVAQSVEATAARAVNLALWGKPEAAARGRRGGDEPRRAPALPGRPGGQPRGARRRRRRPRRARRAARRGARSLGAARPPDRRRPLRGPRDARPDVVPVRGLAL